MSVSYTNYQRKYILQSGVKTLQFSGIAFFQGTEDTLHLTIEGKETINPNKYHITPGEVSLDGIADGGTIEFYEAYTEDKEIWITRKTPKDQPTNFEDLHVERAFDRVALQIQEISDSTPSEVTVKCEAKFAEYSPNTDYKEGQALIYEELDGTLRLLRANKDFTSKTIGHDLGLGNISDVGKQGPTGEQGPRGYMGEQGPQGVEGAQGPAGKDGIFTAIASTEEAQIGLDNAKGMTPMRVKESIEANVKDLPVIQGIHMELDTQGGELDSFGQDLISTMNRVTDLENKTDNILVEGQMDIPNGTVDPIILTYEKDGVVTPLELPRVNEDIGYVVEFNVMRRTDEGRLPATGRLEIMQKKPDWDVVTHYSGWYPRIDITCKTDAINGSCTLYISSEALTGAGYKGEIIYSVRVAGKGVL